MEYFKLEKILYGLSNEENSPIRLVGAYWQVISKLDLWSIISYRINKSTIKRLECIIYDILGEQDNSFDLKPEERSFLRYTLEPSVYSSMLKNGLADSLALLSIYGDSKSKLLGNIDLVSEISFWIKNLLKKDVMAKTWYSFGKNIIELAEAAPESFLDVLEEDVNNDNPSIKDLFSQEADNGECPHANLLWALESLSWNNNFLPKVVYILARLSEIDPGGMYMNRPFESLKKIFLGWINYTSATHIEKIEILKSILLKSFEDVAWQLMIEVLPDDGGGIPTSMKKPIYRRWAEDVDNIVKTSDYRSYEHSIMTFLVNQFKSQIVYRIENIIENITKLHPNYIYQCVDIILAIDLEKSELPGKLVLIEKLRDIISNHRKYHYTKWALQKSTIDKLEEAFNHLSQDDAILKSKYLFDSDYPALIKPIISEEDYYDVLDKEIKNLRIQAIDYIYSEKHIEGINELIKICNCPEHIGRTIIDSKIYLEVESYLISWLESENINYLSVTQSYLYGMYFTEKERINKYIEDTTDWSSKKIANLFLSLPFISEIFDILELKNEEVKEYYWSHVKHYFLLKDDIQRLNYVVTNLFNAERPIAAIDAAGQIYFNKMHTYLDCNLLVKILTQIVTDPKDMDRISIRDVKNDILHMIEYLQNNIEKKSELHQIEWMYMEIFRFEKQKPITLEEEIRNDPKSFVELISFIALSSTEINEDTNSKVDEIAITQRNKNAWELLDLIVRLPGQQEDGSIDKGYIANWVKNAREELQRLNILQMGDDRMGNYFAKCAIGSDNIWPNEAVRNIIEEIRSKEFDIGFQCGRENSRGITWKNYYDGGEQERMLSLKYFEDANKIVLKWPRTAGILRSIAESYEYHANREDKKIELR